MQLCSVAEGKCCLWPSTCSAAVPVPGRQHWCLWTLTPGVCPFQGMDGPFTSPQTAVLEQFCAPAGTVFVGGTGHGRGGAGPSLAVPSAQAKQCLQQLFFCALIPSKGFFASCCCAGKDESFMDSAEWEHRLLKVQHCEETQCREVLACHKEPCSHMSHHGTGTASQMLLWSGCVPLWCCLFLFVPSPRRVLGKEWQVALMEGMLGEADPQRAVATWECGKRQRARERWLFLFSNSS